jgi:DNA invertase Pin-like site-specific DNA recombinase
MKAFSYLRVSDRSQISGDGFPRQREAIRRQAGVMGAVIVREFAEEGITGDSTWSDRPAFQAMVSAILDTGIHTVIVENLSRLSRAYVVQDAILVFLASKNVSLVSADTGEDVTAAFHGDPMKKAIIQMQAVFSELEKNSLVRKLRAARERKRAETGACEGVKPFGTFPGEAETIEEMRRLRRKPIGKAKRASFAKIAAALNARGLPTRTGKPWAAETVRKILARK